MIHYYKIRRTDINNFEILFFCMWALQTIDFGHRHVKLLGLVKSVTKMVTGCLRVTKVAIFVVKD